MIQLARTAFYGRPNMSVAVTRAIQVGATEVFVLFYCDGILYGDVFTAAAGEIDTLTSETGAGENNYLGMTFAAGPAASTAPDIVSAAIVDQTPPVITVLGDNPASVVVEGDYTDAGATAVDDIDGDITTSIITDDSGLDVDTVGAYTITYTVTDAAGNTDTATRTVNVTAE